MNKEIKKQLVYMVYGFFNAGLWYPIAERLSWEQPVTSISLILWGVGLGYLSWEAIRIIVNKIDDNGK